MQSRTPNGSAWTTTAGTLRRVSRAAGSREAATPASVLVSSVHGTQRGLRRRRSVRSAGRDRCAVEQTSRVCRDAVARTVLTRLLMTHRFIRFRRCVQPCAAHAQPMWPPPAADPEPVTALGCGTTSAASGAIPSQRRTGTIRRMTNASVPNSASSTPWHAVFAGYGDLEEATSSGSQVRVCEASLATALDQRHEMTSHRALRRSCGCCRPVVYEARPSTVRTPAG